METTNAIYGGTIGYATAAAQVEPEQPFTAAVGSRLSTLLELLEEGRSALYSTGDRLLGGIPRGVGCDPAAKPNGVAAEIIARLEVAITAAHDVLGEARRLQSGI